MPYSYNPFTGKFDLTDTSVVNNAVDTQLGVSTVISGIQTGATWELPGPFTNEAGAISAGVATGRAYYDNGGTVRVVQ
jgi:hypothetical protein